MFFLLSKIDFQQFGKAFEEVEQKKDMELLYILADILL